jgi:hypothetical protein
MKESYDDERMYCDDFEFPVEIRNYREVMRSHDYSRYEKRFRALADSHQLSPAQRPKLDKTQFAALLKELRDAIAVTGEEDFLDNEKNMKAARRLLIYDQFEELG